MTEAEYLADLGARMARPGLLVAELGPDPEEDATGLAIVKLAMVLRRQHALQFRSLVEEWDLPRIVKELY